MNQASNITKNHWLEDGNMRIILAFTALLFPHLLNCSYTTEILRPAFEKTFADRCNPQKYPFMERYYQNLENPSDRFVHFVFHEHGLKNGGFGDRLAGLVSSAFIAVRFNRTLVIESGNGFDELFRPYHPRLHDYVDPITKKTEVRWLQDDSTNNRIGPNYRNWTSWAPYDESLDDNDETEYDLWNCINIGGAWTSTCGMDKMDAAQKNVKIRGNRGMSHYFVLILFISFSSPTSDDFSLILIHLTIQPTNHQHISVNGTRKKISWLTIKCVIWACNLKPTFSKWPDACFVLRCGLLKRCGNT